jgi:hypothetical protein
METAFLALVASASNACPSFTEVASLLMVEI